MKEWDEVLRQLADDPDEDYERDGGTVMLVRQGQQHLLNMKSVPGIGVAVETASSGSEGQHELVPITRYIQKELLGLPRLAAQLIRALDKAVKDRPVPFVEGPAECIADKERHTWADSASGLRQHLNEKEAGTTRFVQLMAPAGQGKTVLLEQIALENARAYRPDEYPVPLLLPVDVLGRYVGSIDDAIAGSLNNTYKFANLTQQDVVECIRQGWIILALDGFDELVARVGARDAFSRLSGLLEQLKGAGAIVVSARESFFELYQITAAIRTYLQPKQGSYDTSVVKLLPWNHPQGVRVFRALGSPTPEADLDALSLVFEGDTEIIYQPFFLTRLANLWRAGERFGGAGTVSGRQARISYVIETFIQRESTEKWQDRQGNALLAAKGHNIMLAAIAEEMWRSGAFRLDVDELKLAAEIGIHRLGLPPSVVEDVKARIPTHAVIRSTDKRYSFQHDRFFHFFLGYEVALHLHEESQGALRAVLEARELGPQVIDWVIWHSLQFQTPLLPLLGFLLKLLEPSTDGVLRTNVAALLAKFLPKLLGQEFTASAITFVGDVFAGNTYRNVRLERCQFWNLDVSGTTFENCVFSRCLFGDIRTDEATKMSGSQFLDCSFTSLELGHEQVCLFAPVEIDQYLRTLGAAVTKTDPAAAFRAAVLAVSEEAIRAVHRYISSSVGTCDVAVEDLEDRFGEMATAVAKIGVRTGVMRQVTRPTSGPKKTLVRFQVDRDMLRRGHMQRTGNEVIDRFWSEVAGKYPA
jgi:hypothetical protein